MITLLTINSVITATMDEGKQTLLDLLEKIAKEQKYVNNTVDLKAVSAGGSNITSALFLSTIRANDKPDLKLFAKVALLSDHVRKHSPMRCQFTTELYFYTKLKKQYERIQDKHNVLEDHRVRMPKLYGCCDKYLSETLVLEDLVAQGFENFDRQQPADLEYMTAAIDLMAKFHALSLAFHNDDPVSFKEASDTLTMDISKIEALVPVMKPKAMANALAATEGENREKLEKFFKQEPCLFVKFMDTFRSKKRNILVHGDFKPNNLMHRRRNGKLEIVLMDFQLVLDGDPLRDLLYFIFTATDEAFRRSHYHAILDLYHERLSEALRRFQIDVETVYSESTYRAQLEEYSMVGLTIAVILLPLVLVEEEDIPNFDDDYKMTDFVVQGSKLYKERLNGVINNYVEWGLL
ncbi:uncharacterized protein LOC133515401 isoform X1 [Cydia pomonella]|uniref:uncharacterized protein LOC133515401 isoform X1 n=1 Tax=Cydia pomonella TaxID=82600 RepID=UPI002ADDDE14|nr:uncharacterized protein LOC133515401 isoform X1 [Cydia pomonella]